MLDARQRITGDWEGDGLTPYGPGRGDRRPGAFLPVP